MCIECFKIVVFYFDLVFVLVMFVNVLVFGLIIIVFFDFFVIIEGYINFGGFCYLVYFLRCSYELEIRLVIKFLRDNIENIDLCRARLVEVFDVYYIFREFVFGWIVLNLILSIVCFFFELYVWIVKIVLLVFF